MNRTSRLSSLWARGPSPSKAAEAAEPVSDQPEWGMHILVNKDADSTEAIDIVAIHGINGHWNNTWKDESTGTNWLQYSIPKYQVLKTARVMSFSYNSSVQFSKSVSTIADFADELLENLMALRVSGAEQDRPILFVCHSLGGIVFKQATYEVDRYQSLFRAIAGVAFFGTPHRGSNIASLGHVFGRILKAASFGAHTNAQLLKDLQTDSQMLDRITTVFVDRKYNFQICSFFETEKMDFMSSVVVDRHSAVLGIEREIVAPMNGNHRSMCRFTRNDARLPVVLANIAQMVRRWTTFNRPLLEGLFMESLGPSNHLVHKNRNPSPVPGTCSWVLRHPEFRHWHEATGPSLMWLSANPGCGKSVMMSFLIDHFQSSVVSSNVHMCCWFFKSDNQEQKSAIFAVRALLRQLLEAHRGPIESVQEAAKGKNLESLQEVWRLFTQAVQGGTSSKEDERTSHTTICFIDGLDECEAENWIQVAINRLNPGTLTTPCCIIRLKAEDESSLISADISLVVRAAIADLVDQGFPEPILHDIQRRLIARADRTFIWVTLIIDLLRDKVEAGASEREMYDILESRTVDQIFTEFLRGRPDAPKTRKMFSILLAAARPLKVIELGIALALTPEHNALSNSRKPFRPGRQDFESVKQDLVYPIERHIRSLGGHFIRIIRNEVYRRTPLDRNKRVQSFRGEDTTSGYDDWNIIQDPDHCSWHHSFTYSSCHALLLDTCTTYLYMIGQATVQNRNLGIDQKILINYVSNAWFVHLAAVLNRIDSRHIPYYHNLCHPRFPGFGSWTETYWETRGEIKSETGNREINPTFGMTDDEVQDYYIQRLEQEARHLPSVWDDDYYSDDERTVDSSSIEDARTLVDKEYAPARGTIPIPGRRATSAPNREYGTLSVNPTAKSNSNFPLGVDANGFVFLDHSLSKPRYLDIARDTLGDRFLDMDLHDR
ncbi:hypothetical protein F4777DRAFT_591619 [Nemania sp. FL0916]|nr:hypothetical protein F4777DRAFT_591619 [Nemania sp. FL0916]